MMMVHSFLYLQLSLCVKPTTPPIPNLNKEVKALITQVMSARYNSSMKALDMSKFDQDDGEFYLMKF